MSKGTVARLFLLSGLLLALGSEARAQVATGTPPFGSFAGGPDIINLQNLNVHISVPILSKAGRMIPFIDNYGYDSSIWQPVGTSGNQVWTLGGGWAKANQAATGYISYSRIVLDCIIRGVKHAGIIEYTNWIYLSPDGSVHPFVGTTTVFEDGCSGTATNHFTSITTDGSGYTLTATGATGIVTGTDGMTNNSMAFSPTSTLTDRNGNQVTETSAGVYTDTTGSMALTVTAGTPPSSTTFQYTAPNGSPATFTVNYGTYTVRTNFGCSGISEFGPLTEYLVSSIQLPDQTSYTFSYEDTPGFFGDTTGRLKSVTFPTGGGVQYLYSGGSGGITCSDGSAATLQRTITPGGVWTYARTSSNSTSSTLVTDPMGNQTILNFYGAYQTESQTYQGSTLSGTLLNTVFTCYNGATPNCNNTFIALPITERSTYIQWPGTGAKESRADTFYNTYELVTEKDEYAYGAGAPGSIVRKTVTAYAPLGNGIVSMPSSITVEDGSNNVKSQTTYCYDEGTPHGTSTCAATGPPTATSGTPQHVAVSGSRGNATTIASLVTGTTTLGKTYTYFDTGNILTATDVNGASTTYTYSSSSCGNSFATSVSEPLSLSRSMAWNCTGGVEISAIDENLQPTSVTYNDADFWRPNKTTDQESDITNITYDAQTSFESSMLFGASTSDRLATVDGLGRVQVSQVKESPSSSTYDSVETDYDSVGRPSRKTLPYATTAGLTNSSAPSTSTTYDAMSRAVQVTDSETPNPLTITLAYTQNDTYRTLGPAPTGENEKRKQFEYDALGRMTSVCEITSATGSGSCAQTSPVTGYWTTYTYDLNNNLNGVTQNAQSTGSQQTRTYAYDDLGRMTSETNPESGTTTYTYDSDATCGTYKGDLVKKVDAVGNVVCYKSDALHRLTSTFVSSGPYASSTPYKYFVYDTATVNGVAMGNAKTRIAEAYTCTTSSCTSKITDIGFGYTARGEVSDVYESTPNSGGYYHTSATFWANGALDVLTAKYGSTAITGLPTFTYAPDGEGRINTVSASAGQNPVTGTTYNVASLTTQVTLGSSDTDSFTFDPNSNRMTKYTFAVNGQSVAGTLTWNSIGTLGTLAITDPFFGAGNQTCNYRHDDLSRIASANCGSPWSQTFSYSADGSGAFGNLSKSGTVSFQPTYSYLTNRMTQVGGSTPTYDANGNATNDTAHTYTWDAAGRPVTADNVGLTYDAMGRIVEQNKSGIIFQLIYAPSGRKFAIMNGSTLQKAFVPLTGGSQAVYNSSGLAYYRHSDWAGSSRFASTPARAMYYDGAYAAFGEPYAQTGTADLSFTGMNQDTVANLYDFPAREYNNIHGRWPSPDPAGLSAASIADPQSFNRYAYVSNSPLGAVDPSGLCPDCRYPPPRDNCLINTCDPLELMTLLYLTAPTSYTNDFTPAYATWDWDDNMTWYPQIDNYVPNGQTVGTYQTLIGGSASSDSNTSWWGTFASTFIKGFSIRSIKRDLEDPQSCFGQFVGEQTPERLIDTPAFQDSVHDSAAILGTSTAITYAGAKLLTSPLNSSIVKGLVAYGEKANTAFAVVGVAMEAKAFINEMESLAEGKCH